MTGAVAGHRCTRSNCRDNSYKTLVSNVDHYATLNVLPSSDDVVIRAAYRALMLKYHPDMNSSPAATAQAALINEAFHILSEPARRAAYDRARRQAKSASSGGAKSRSQSSTSKPAAPASPADLKQEAGSSEFGSPASWKTKAAGWAGIVLGVVLVGVLAITTGPRPRSSPDLNSMPPPDDGYANPSEGGVEFPGTQNNVTSSNFINSLAIDERSLSLTSPAPPLHYSDIQSAAGQFVRVLDRSGMAGARSFSEQCHASARRQPTWSALDRCVAFDFAAFYVDLSVAQSLGAPPNSYFAFMQANATEQYGATGASYLINQRLQSIERAVRPAVNEEMEARRSTTAPTTIQSDDEVEDMSNSASSVDEE